MTTPHQIDPASGCEELYRETQPLHQNMIVGVLVPFGAVIAVVVVGPLIAVSSIRPPWPVLVLIAALMVGMPAVLLLIRMTTVVTRDELIVTYRPFPGRRVPIGSIRDATAIRYNPLASGGWGWRISPQYHRVMNVSGDRGVHVVWGDARRDQALFGSRDAEGLAEAIELARFAASERPVPVRVRDGA